VAVPAGAAAGGASAGPRGSGASSGGPRLLRFRPRRPGCLRTRGRHYVGRPYGPRSRHATAFRQNCPPRGKTAHLPSASPPAEILPRVMTQWPRGCRPLPALQWPRRRARPV
jgi:hypothetical protein